VGRRRADGGRGAGGRLQAAGGRRQAAGGRRQAAGGRRQAAGGGRRAARTRPPSGGFQVARHLVAMATVVRVAPGPSTYT